jgi:hypothetical protein
MIRQLFDLLYGSVPAQWECAYGLDESVARLRAATRKSVFSMLTEPAAVGKVTELRVSLQRVIPMVRNSFKPFFFGQFVTRDGRVFLTGRFTMHVMVKVFMSFWFGFLALAVIGSVASALLAPAGRGPGFLFLVFPLGMCAFGLGLVRFGTWLARNDVQWLTDVIRGAICTPAVNPNAGSTVPQSSASFIAGRPRVVVLTAAVLAAMGVMNLVGSMALLAAIRAGAPTDLPPAMLHDALVAQGALLLAMAVGIYLRLRLAWLAGFLLLASSWGWIVAFLWGSGNVLGPPLGFKVVFAALALYVVIYWGRWWNAQRARFVED